MVQISSAINIRIRPLPVPALPVSRRPFMFTLSGQRTFLFFTRILWNFEYRLSTLRSTCCITNVNFQLLPFWSYLASNFIKKGGAFQKSTKSTKKFFWLIYIKDISKWSIHAKVQFDIGFTSGSMNLRSFLWEFQC